jgi:uncharacterized protein with von Willebrand factor type A (vWA) domain
MSERARNIVDLNLLPRDARPAETSPLTIAYATVLTAGIAGLLVLSGQAYQARREAGASQERTADIEVQLHQVQLELAQHRGLRLQLEESKTKLEALTSLRQEFQDGTHPLSHDLVALFEAVPPSVTVKRVSGGVGGLQVSGGAPSPLEAIAYADALSAEYRFAGARLASFSPSATGGEFTLEVER